MGRWKQLNASFYQCDLLSFENFLQKLSTFPESDICSISDSYTVFCYMTSKGTELDISFDGDLYCYYFKTKIANNKACSDGYGIVVPVNSLTPHLTPCRLMSLFSVGGILRRSIALVARDTD